jgi:N-acetylglucosaminyldiphosphoundecaprenol N-acetyl-beta-D-mannosaminyltransferase
MLARIPFLGLQFNLLDAAQAANVIAERARKFGPFAYVTTPNVDHLVRLDRRPDLKPLYTSSWLTLCDSRIIELLAEASYFDLPVAPGADVVEILFKDHIRQGDRISIVGGTKDMVEKLRAKYGLRNLIWFDAPKNLDTDEEARTKCVRFLAKYPAHFVFLAVGSPQQELIAQEARASGACSGVAICCGAALEFLSGQARRAPQWMRARRLEWLHRLALNPTRLWRRYLIDGPRIFMMWHRWRTEPGMTFVPANDVAEVTVTGGQNGRAEAGGVVLGSVARSDISPAA